MAFTGILLILLLVGALLLVALVVAFLLAEGRKRDGQGRG